MNRTRIAADRIAETRARRPRAFFGLGALLCSLALGLGIGQAGTPPAEVEASSLAEPQRIAAPRACFVRLPDLPSPRYGGFGAYNPETRVLSYAGGAAKLAEDITMTYHDLFAIQLDGQAAWKRLPYNSNVGYTRQTDRGCREMTSVQIEPGLALSVLGKDGCDNGRVDKGRKGGDLVSLAIGRAATSSEVRWLPGGNAAQLPAELSGNQGRLARLFAVYDSLRDRVVFGQGSFDTGSPRDTLDEVFAAQRSGHVWQLRRLRPHGGAPSPRYGSCAAYVHQPEAGVDGVIVVGGNEPGRNGGALAEVWWLDFAGHAAGEWREITARFDNMEDFGPRREGACAYDPESGKLYSLMGRASKSVKDGAKRSAGLWMADLSELGRSDAMLSWARLAPDDLEGLRGRRLIPNVWDPIDKRLFAIGGRNDLDELSDVWAIYPEVGPEACAALDPFAPVPPALLPSPTAPALEPSPTSVARPTALPTLTPPGPPLPEPSAEPGSPTPSEPSPEPATPILAPVGEGRCYLPALLTGNAR